MLTTVVKKACVGIRVSLSRGGLVHLPCFAESSRVAPPTLRMTLHPTPPTSTRAGSRKTRVYVFREFLLKTYGAYFQEVQQQRRSGNDNASPDDPSLGDVGCVILDVAGGKGDLSWLLRNVDGIDSVVVDPRVTMHHHIIKSIRYLREHPEETESRAVPGLPTYQPLAALMPKLQSKLEVEKDGTYTGNGFVQPKHLRVFLNEELVEAVRKMVDQESTRVSADGEVDKGYLRSESDVEWRTFWAIARQAASREASGIDRHQNKTGSWSQKNDPDYICQKDGAADKALRTIIGAKLIVGFHPDQATDSCVALAELLGVPFCIVPCCVFPNQFPHRSLIDGTRVKSYVQLIEYLQERCPGAKTALLDFHFTETAKNLVLFTLPGASSKVNRN